MSVLEGSIGIFPRRILVGEDAARCRAATACRSRLRQRASPRWPLSARNERGRRPRRPARAAPAARAAIASAMTPSCWRRRCSARAGDHAVDLGAGVGAAGLALARRVEGLAVTLVEIDPALAALAGENAARNGLGERVRAVCLDVAAPAAAFAAAGLAAGDGRSRADEPAVQCGAKSVARSRPPSGACRCERDAARGGWTRRRGCFARKRRVTLIWRADGLDAVLAALADGFGAITVVAGPSEARRAGDPGAGARGQGKPRAAVAAAGLHARRCGGKADRRGGSGAARRRCVAVGWGLKPGPLLSR